MTDQIPAWNITERAWQDLLDASGAHIDILEDGAYVRRGSEENAEDLQFYATSVQKPSGWHYPLIEPIPNVPRLGAFIGRVWHERATGFVQFEVVLYAAAQALRADYESDVSDLDYVTYEQAVEQAISGSPEDLQWLQNEFKRLVTLSSP